MHVSECLGVVEGFCITLGTNGCFSADKGNDLLVMCTECIDRC
jgi:hypothetical protein